MHSLPMPSLACNEINRFACATNGTRGTCLVRACMLASDRARLLELPVLFWIVEEATEDQA